MKMAVVTSSIVLESASAKSQSRVRDVFQYLVVLACAESYGFLGIAIVAPPPPPNLLLNPDILDIIATFNAFALEKSIKQVNMKLFKRFTVLTSL